MQNKANIDMNLNKPMHKIPLDSFRMTKTRPTVFEINYLIFLIYEIIFDI